MPAGRSPLAGALFALPGVARVFLGADFITVTKTDEIAWQTLKPQVLGAIMEHFVAGRPVLEGADVAAATRTWPRRTGEIVAQIKELIDTRVRPAVAGDGGDIVFRGYRDGIVRLHMQGACSRLPVVQRHAEARHREHAAPLRARGAGGRTGRVLTARRGQATG